MNKEILDRYVSEGWLISQKHPRLPLSIYNYSQKTQYDGHWDEITLACRGLIVDSSTGKVIIRPFQKFFNYEEVEGQVPWKGSDYVYIQEKMDGSLGILFYYGESMEWVLATRGSFTSAQALKGMEILKSKYNLDAFEKSVAYLVEIIYPENRIVVDYGKEKITFLGACLNRSFGYEDGGDDELHWTTAQVFFKMSGISKSDTVETKQFFNHPQVKEHLPFGPEIYKYLKEKNTKNKEGFVLRFFPSNFRCKIKFEDYVALHRIVTQVSSYDIWENLKDTGKLPESFLTHVPDEFYSWVKKTEEEIKEKFRFTKSLHTAHVNSVKKAGLVERKDLAEAFMRIKDDRINTGVLFLMLDGRDPDLKIWDMVKPEYSRPFSSKGEI